MSADLATAALSYHDAQQLTERIKLKVGTIQDNIDALAALVTRAKNGSADVVLGYPSWTAYVVDVVGSDPLDLTRTERKKLVGFLATEGMPARAIAPVIGMDEKTVRNDISEQATAEFVRSRPATVTSLDGRERPSTQPVRETETPPTTPRRRPLPDVARDAGWDLRKSVERLQRLAADDRFDANKEQMAPHLRSHLTNAIEVCQDLLSRINN